MRRLLRRLRPRLLPLLRQGVCNRYAFLAALALAAVLVAAFGVALPVRATVRDASLPRLHLATNATHGTASLAYDLALTVVLRNRNWAMRADLAAPLDAELLVAGRRFDGARLACTGRSVAPRGSEVFHVLAASSPSGVPLAPDAADDLAREMSASGVFEMEVKLTGEVRYRPVHAGRSRRLEVTCPVKMALATPTTPRGTHTHLMVFDKVVTCY